MLKNLLDKFVASFLIFFHGIAAIVGFCF